MRLVELLRHVNTRYRLVLLVLFIILVDVLIKAEKYDQIKIAILNFHEHLLLILLFLVLLLLHYRDSLFVEIVDAVKVDLWQLRVVVGCASQVEEIFLELCRKLDLEYFVQVAHELGRELGFKTSQMALPPAMTQTNLQMLPRKEELVHLC